MRVHVVGLGLVGSSIALGLRRRDAEVTGEDRDPARAAQARDLGAVAAIAGAPREGIVFLATPASSIVDVARRVLADESDGLVVTDVAGVKGQIAGELLDPRFVPGHPMAGSEQEGPAGADPDLFVGATWVLTPTEQTSEAAFSAVQDAVSMLGGDVVVLPPERHDELVAVVSHVPHLAAATLMSLAADSPVDREALMRLAAGGFRDMTRIAAGSPGIWPDICRDNSAAIVPALDRLIERLEDVRSIVAGADRSGLVALLDRASVARRNLPARGAPPPRGVELRVVVPDRPGVLAEVTSAAAQLAVNIYDIEIAHSSEGPRGVLVLVVAPGSGDALVSALRKRGYRVAATSEGTGAAS